MMVDVVVQRRLADRQTARPRLSYLPPGHHVSANSTPSALAPSSGHRGAGV